MRQRIIRSMFTLAAAVALVVSFVMLQVDRYWIASGGTPSVLEPEYVFYIIVILVMLLVAVMGISMLLANRIIRPLERSEDDYEELSHLKRRIIDQSSQLASSSHELEAKERNLSLVVANMSEGLILLDRRGIIIMMNNSAGAFLGVDGESFVGKHLLAANQSVPLQAAINTAMGGKKAQDVLEIGDSIIEVSVDPVVVEKVIRGAVLFLRDITERQAAEKMRREFSANVSHELKTPLTSISGYAELIKEGMVQPQDVAPFAGKIYSEAQRLILLTEDIMRLSRLDEGGMNLPMEELELMTIVQSVSERLAEKAAKHNIRVLVTGSGGRMIGNAGLLDEMVYNLCENAIKYNRQDGSVNMNVRESGDYVIFSVCDTGVGIPVKHQGRIFERFYRVDKSHSKATGGTGLGLSIVKNGAAFHRARIELDSREGEGTTIRLFFTKARDLPDNQEEKG